MQVPKSNIIKKSLLVLLSVLLFSSVVFGDILPLDERIKNEMRGVSCHTGCPVGLDELRLVRVKYYSFDETTKNGELVVHKDVADEVLKIFGELYDIHYPIKQIVRIEKFKGNDFDSIEADNTSAFNCRNTTGEQKYSKHSYGKAIDINPIENPYIFRGNHTSHKASYKYINRKLENITTPQEKAMLVPNSDTVKIFKKYGWRWGGDWNIKDYQHFDKK